MTDPRVYDAFLRAGGRVAESALEQLLQAGTILESKKKSGAAKVIKISESNSTELIIKIWHPERLLSSATLNPYNRRFRINARRLRDLGLPAPLVRGWGNIGSGLVRFICYEALPGRSLRQLVPDVDLTATARFIADIHDRGVDFRSLHMGNILHAGGDRFGLIDLTDCSFLRHPLPITLRCRRLAYFCSHRRDLAFLAENDRWLEFVDAYCESISRTATGISGIRRQVEIRLPAGLFGSRS